MRANIWLMQRTPYERKPEQVQDMKETRTTKQNELVLPTLAFPNLRAWPGPRQTRTERAKIAACRRATAKKPDKKKKRDIATARLAQSAERKALNLVVVGSSPTMGVSSFFFGGLADFK